MKTKFVLLRKFGRICEKKLQDQIFEIKSLDENNNIIESVLTYSNNQQFFFCILFISFIFLFDISKESIYVIFG